jgi:uncharacterized protein (DUF488 family)
MIYSLGHSTLVIDEFAQLAAPVDVIIDVRSHPGSSAHKQFDREQMQKWLPLIGKKYEWEPRLGGWRKEHARLAANFAEYGVNVLAYCSKKFPKGQIAQDLPSTDKPSWTNRGLYEYSFFMTLPEFLDAAQEVIERSRKENIGLLCAEGGTWWRCHRSLIADYLVFKGSDILHLTGYQTKTKGYRLKTTPHSDVIGTRLQRYDPRIIQAWKAWDLSSKSQ